MSKKGSLDDIFNEFENEEKTEEEETEETTETEEETEETESTDEWFPEEAKSESEPEVPEEVKPSDSTPPPKQKEESKTKSETPKDVDSLDGFFVEGAVQDDAGQTETIPIRQKKKETKQEFDLSEEGESKQKSRAIYGLKGSGKTYLALSHKGKIAVISFDRKATPVKKTMFNNDPRIKVFDGIRYLNKKDTDLILYSANLSYDYIIELIDGPIREFNPDVIVIDGTEVFIRDICEMAMRYREGFRAFQAFEYKYWDERNMLVDNVHNAITALAKDCVIYTAYVKETVEKIERGQVITQKYRPKWAANIKMQVNTVIYVESEEVEGGLATFWATVTSSKEEELLTGIKSDVTDGGISVLIEDSAKRKKKLKKRTEK